MCLSSVVLCTVPCTQSRQHLRLVVSSKIMLFTKTDFPSGIVCFFLIGDVFVIILEYPFYSNVFRDAIVTANTLICIVCFFLHGTLCTAVYPDP